MSYAGVLGNRSFRNLWLAGLLAGLGTQVSRIGLLLYLFGTQGSVVNLALLVLLDTLPGALAAPLAGAVADRVSKRTVMVAAGLARAAFAAAIALWPALPAIYLLAALGSVVSAFFHPARSAALPLVVRREQVVAANGIDQSGANAMLIAGPMVGAQLFLHLGLAATLALDAAAFLLCAACAAAVRVRPAPPAAGVDGGIREGWRYVARHPLALHMTALLFVALACTGVWAPLAPFFIRERLGGGEEVLGWQLATFGWGAVLGGMAAPRLVRRFGKGPVLYAALLAEGASLAAYALARRLDASLAVLFLWGIAVSVIVVSFHSILQRVVDERFLGRVFSLVKQSENAAVVLSMGAVVLLQRAVGNQPILLWTGVFYLAVTAASAATRSGRLLAATR